MIERYRLATSENITDNMKCSTILAHAPEMVKVILRSAPAGVDVAIWRCGPASGWL